jgi:tetratricopeptide (TPR) repeat protein
VLFCKCKPNYLDAVTNYERAAENYHKCNRFQEEIKCRERAVICNRALGECFKEGQNLEKIANIYLINFSKFDDALLSIENSHVAYRSKGDYKESLRCLINISKIFRDMNQVPYALKCMKVAFDGCLQLSSAGSGREEDHIFVFLQAFETYIDMVLLTEDYKEGSVAATNFTKAIISDKVSSRLMKCHGIAVICNLILEDFEANQPIFDNNYNDSSGVMADMNSLHNAYINADKGAFKDVIRMIGSSYSAVVIKKLNDNFMSFYEKKAKEQEKYIINDEESFTEKMK